MALYYSSSFSWFYVRPHDGYIQPKHAAGLHTDKVVFRQSLCTILYISYLPYTCIYIYIYIYICVCVCVCVCLGYAYLPLSFKGENLGVII